MDPLIAFMMDRIKRDALSHYCLIADYNIHMNEKSGQKKTPYIQMLISF